MLILEIYSQFWRRIVVFNKYPMTVALGGSVGAEHIRNLGHQNSDLGARHIPTVPLSYTWYWSICSGEAGFFDWKMSEIEQNIETVWNSV